ncbi:hypothetical protein ABEB36_001563 [Hypothenemus hampei]|uniref:ABC-type xenobiotic transporter n=1 Tax=Hypothenemus hampei TaxID=57062 RepID=A0ABD1FF30_HYPHA
MITKDDPQNREENGKDKPSPLDAEFEPPNEEQTEPDENVQPSSFFGLYRYATGAERFLLFIGVVMSLGSGAIQPLNNLLFGSLSNGLISYARNCWEPDAPECPAAADDLMIAVRDFAVWSSVIGVGMWITSYIGTETFSYVAIKQVFRVRSKYLKSVLNKDIAWYDMHRSGDFASRMADDLSKLEDGIGEKVPLFLSLEGMFISGIVLALVKGWELALICLVSLPVSMIVVGFIAFLTTKLSQRELDAYGDAGSIAEEVITSIRTVIAFGGELLEKQRYEKGLLFARNNNIKRHLFEALGYGSVWLLVFASYGLSFWYGVKLMLEGNSTYDAGNMITVFFSVMSGSMGFGAASPFIEAFATAKAAGGKIFHVINTLPHINLSKNNGQKMNEVKGNIELKNVHFNYPSRSLVSVLQGLSLKVNAGDTVALVGSSGCGKSTVLQMVQRFYDPLEGQVFIDGNDIKNLDLAWYRQSIGVVSQEPVLFGTTIFENIRYGNQDAKEEDIVHAAKMANAHNFIKSLPNGYQTLQRIAIARALVRNPAILLLDEATSALDTNSEAKVQAALEKASKNRTTIIVAHRLTTIRGANKIIVISNGKVVEEGTHKELMELKQEYYTLVTTQVQGIEEMENEKNRKSSYYQSIDYDDNEDEDVDAIKNVDEEQETDNFIKKASLWSIVKLNSPEWFFLLLGSIGAALMGATMPMFAIIFGSILQVLQDTDEDYVRSETNKYVLYFVYAGILSFVATFLQMYMFGRAGQKLTYRIRSRMFEALLRQEIGYFDRKDNGVGTVCAKLSNEAAQVQGATGQRIGAIISSLSTAVICIVVAVYYEWRLGLVTLTFFPVLVFVTFLQQRQMFQENEEFRISLEKSTKIAVEAVGSIRTVASLGCEDTFYNLYINELTPHIKTSLRNSHGRSAIIGLSRGLMNFAFASCMYYGGYLIIHNNVPYGDVMKVVQSLIMGTVSIGNSLAFTPNLDKGLVAAKTVMNLINREPKVRNSTKPIVKKEATGNLEYSNVHFSYPSRSQIQVLGGLNLSVLQGKTVALVGHSGCGKSTIIQLLERFYDPSDGTISFDDEYIKSITLSSLRYHLGIVSQEPNLFNRTIKENIAYGDNARQVNEAEIIEAAKNANIHNFISKLPQGYETKLGDKGTQLSGGQKQRIAIARALVRNPKILLLDEATSALDAESEKVVQEALDNAKQGRTCLTIAHRLTTIQDADVICVVSEGIIAEQGTHSELIEKKGLYYRLHTFQH